MGPEDDGFQTENIMFFCRGGFSETKCQTSRDAYQNVCPRLVWVKKTLRVSTYGPPLCPEA